MVIRHRQHFGVPIDQVYYYVIICVMLSVVNLQLEHRHKITLKSFLSLYGSFECLH